ncbi:MAG: ABC transporter permease [Clostridia bacterium]|nr:ABC transporter permease [Clostridia bacterium]
MISQLISRLKVSLRTVILEWKGFLFFYIALFLIQLVLGFTLYTVHIRKNYAKEVIEANYNYHLTVEGLNSLQANELENLLIVGKTTGDKMFSDYTVQTWADGSSVFRVRLNAPLKTSFSNFRYKYLRDFSDATITPSPLYNYKSVYAFSIVRSGVGLSLLIGAFSFLVLWQLFRNDLQHRRYQYALYMSCGAGFPRLFSIAVSHLLAVSLITFLPALAGSTFLALTVFRITEHYFSFSLWIVLWMFVLSMAIICPAVLLPVRRLSKKPPIELMRSQNNAGWVTPPRRSSRAFLRKKIRFASFTKLSMWRFRKYFISLLLSAILFSSAFLAGLTATELKAVADSTTGPDVSLSLSADPTRKMSQTTAKGYREAVDEITTAILSYDHVRDVDWNAETFASSTMAHLNLPSGHAVYADGLISPSEEAAGYPIAFNRFRMIGASEAWISRLSRTAGEKLQGDPSTVLSEPLDVIITESIAGKQALSFRPGDTLVLAYVQLDKKGNPILKEGADKISTDTILFTGESELLQLQMETYEFFYLTLRVAAVIHDHSTDQYISLAMHPDTYLTVTGAQPFATSVSVYMDESSNLSDVDLLQSEIRNLLSYYNNWSVDETNAGLERVLANPTGTRLLLLTVCIVLLLFTPLVWFFSQWLFHKNRVLEWSLLHAQGVQVKAIRTNHIKEGIILALVSTLFSLGLGIGLSYLMFWLQTVVLPAWNFTEKIQVEFSLSWPYVLLCVLLSVVCAVLSTYIPFRFNRSKWQKIRIRDDQH